MKIGIKQRISTIEKDKNLSEGRREEGDSNTLIRNLATDQTIASHLLPLHLRSHHPKTLINLKLQVDQTRDKRNAKVWAHHYSNWRLSRLSPQAINVDILTYPPELYLECFMRWAWTMEVGAYSV